MERLKVITVPATDLDNSDRLHIAFTVYSEIAGALRASAGWTLKDAIEFYARDNGILRDRISQAATAIRAPGRLPAPALNLYVAGEGGSNVISQARTPAPLWWDVLSA